MVSLPFSIFVGVSAILIGLFLSPIPQNIGFYRFLATYDVTLVGLGPAFVHGMHWSYTFDELYNTCSQISGQNALITGSNSGVGYETAKVLAKCGVNVIMACRNAKKCSDAANKIKEEIKGHRYDNEIITMIVDMSSLKSVQTFSKELLAKFDVSDISDDVEDLKDVETAGTETTLSSSSHHKPSLDILYLNAGIGSGKSSDNELKLSEDGIELVFATNYVGHHLMYRSLEPLLLRSKMARVIQVSSVASFTSFNNTVATSLEILNRPTRNPEDFAYYGQSKLAQIMWVKYLTKRLGENSNIYVNAAHPGAVDTDIWDQIVPDFIMKSFHYVRKNVMWTTEEGSLTQLYLGVAVDKLVEHNVRGKYFHPQAQEVENPFSLDEKVQKELWEFSDELVSQFL
jgi:retinol dehydrogenase-12